MKGNEHFATVSEGCIRLSVVKRQGHFTVRWFLNNGKVTEHHDRNGK